MEFQLKIRLFLMKKTYMYLKCAWKLIHVAPMWSMSKTFPHMKLIHIIHTLCQASQLTSPNLMNNNRQLPVYTNHFNSIHTNLTWKSRMHYTMEPKLNQKSLNVMHLSCRRYQRTRRQASARKTSTTELLLSHTNLSMYLSTQPGVVLAVQYIVIVTTASEYR